MRKALILGLTLVAVVAVVGAIGCSPSPQASPSTEAPTGETSGEVASLATAGNAGSTGIWVTGQGTVTAVPDVAVLSLGVEAEAATVDEAMTAAAEAMDLVMSAVRAGGVAEKDIKTQWFDVYPVRDRTGPSFEGRSDEEGVVSYRVTNMASVTVRNVEATGQLIDAAAEAGGDLVRVHGVTFTVDDPSMYENEAMALAVADARAKAQLLAGQAGVELGEAFYISESGGFSPIYRDAGMGYAEGSVPATPISPGETEITISVQMAFAIQ